MQEKTSDLATLKPINQLTLFGYDDYFNSFIKMFEKNILPNCIFLTGAKGIGKATFAYHFTNFILSKTEESKYSTINFSINEDNLSYKRLSNKIHSNFFLIDNELNNQIKIEQVRNLNKFLSKTTYSQNFKIVLIDGIECLNLNAANALLKAIEEPSKNTFFFIIHDSSVKILDTISSRCAHFKIFFSENEKRNIFTNIAKPYFYETHLPNLDNEFYLNTPGNLLKYFYILNSSKIKLDEDILYYINFFLDNYKIKNDPIFLDYASALIEKYYYQLSLNNQNNLSLYAFNQTKVLRQIHDMKKYNLNEKNTFFWIKNILENEKK